AARRARLTDRIRTRRAQLAKDSAAGTAISPEYLSHAIGEAVGTDAIIINEYPLRPDHCAREKPGTFFSLGPAGGLGWGLGAALGAKLAAPDELIVATLGDGSYMFANPMVGHWVSAVHKLPILTVVFNNSRYGAVRRATLSMFKDGAAGETDGRTLADLDPSPPFEEMARAQGAHAERVEKPAELPEALARARGCRQRAQAGAAQRHYALLRRYRTKQSESHGGVHAHRRLHAFHPGEIFRQDRREWPRRHRQARARNSLHP
ncbi:MAG: thiamine pyrophosphate-dependent enzyme, partial [Pseudolabrys sp.]